MGPDALDPALTIEVWRERIRRHPGELKNTLRNQAFVAGIGNAYSDEILHAARLQPFRKRSTLASEEIDELYAAMRSTLEASVELLRGARPADVREAGARPPRRPQPRRRGVPQLRGAYHAGDRGRVRDRLLPGLPALTAGRPADGIVAALQGRTMTWPGWIRRGSVIPLSRLSTLSVVPKRSAMPPRVSPLLIV